MVTRPAAPGLVGAFAEDVLIDAAGDVVVAGDGTNVEPPTAGAVTKLAASDGTPIWTTGITLNAPRLLLHPSGNVLLVAVENVTVSLTVGFARLDGATAVDCPGGI
jgi:hypothetical protein